MEAMARKIIADLADDAAAGKLDSLLSAALVNGLRARRRKWPEAPTRQPSPKERPE
jgi:hypothetical protein